MTHTFTTFLTHIIFSTKYRQLLLTADLKPRLFPYMGGIIRSLGGATLSINGPADHVHILATLSTTTTPAEFLREIKCRSSAWVNETFPANNTFAWQTGYSAFSVSQSMCDRVQAYIADQEQHHQTLSFQEELVRILQKHGVSLSIRDLWWNEGLRSPSRG